MLYNTHQLHTLIPQSLFIPIFQFIELVEMESSYLVSQDHYQIFFLGIMYREEEGMNEPESTFHTSFNFFITDN
jgi:hypothetical protein